MHHLQVAVLKINILLNFYIRAVYLHLPLLLLPTFPCFPIPTPSQIHGLFPQLEVVRIIP